jgi:hypothetical protein
MEMEGANGNDKLCLSRALMDSRQQPRACMACMQGMAASMCSDTYAPMQWRHAPQLRCPLRLVPSAYCIGFCQPLRCRHITPYYQNGGSTCGGAS